MKQTGCCFRQEQLSSYWNIPLREDLRGLYTQPERKANSTEEFKDVTAVRGRVSKLLLRNNDSAFLSDAAYLSGSEIQCNGDFRYTIVDRLTSRGVCLQR